MPLGSECRLCAISEGKQTFGISDIPFYEDENFFAIPSIGSLIEGWSLIVPKKHALSLRQLYGTPDFEAFISEVTCKITSIYGSAIIFEHGSSFEGSITNCGTNHAHLHIVPLPFSLRNDLNESGLSWQSISSHDIAAVANGKEYLFYCDNHNIAHATGLIHVLQHPISQFFRKLIAAKLGKSEISDYRKFLHLETSEITQSRLTALTA